MVPEWKSTMAAGSWSRRPRDHISCCQHEAERAEWKLGWEYKLSKAASSEGLPTAGFHKFPQTQPPTGNPVFRWYLSLWGGIPIQITTDTYLEICQEKVKPHQWLNSTNYKALGIPHGGGPAFLALGWISWCRWVRMGEENWLSLHSGRRRSKPQ